MDQVTSEKGLVIIVAGSDSDKDHIEKIGKSLYSFGIPYNIRICSAHKQPSAADAMMQFYNAHKGPLAFVSVAGGTDALSGMLSFHSLYPVITCPPDGFNMSGLTNPPGSSNAYIQRPDNLGRFVAQMFSHAVPEYREALRKGIDSKIASLVAADDKYNGEVKV